MFKGNFLKKFISVALVVVMLFSVMAPVYAQPVTYSADDVVYVALGDEMTNGTGLDDPINESFVYKVAKHLGAEDAYNMHADEKYRIEEIRYLLDNSYAGDGYTKATFAGELSSTLASKRAQAQADVANAKYITLNAGVNNFATYIIEQMMYYVENGGAVKYDYSFDDFKLDAADVSMDQLQAIKDAVLDRLLAAVPESTSSVDEFVEESLEMMDFVAEVATYTYLSYIVNFNAVVRHILTVNPDVDLYVIGLYNPMQGETVSVSIGAQSVSLGGKAIDTAAHTFEVEIGYFFEGLVEMANAYTQVLAPRAYEYNYVHPGNPTLLIDRMADTSLAQKDRVPAALRSKLLQSAEDTAISMVREMFATYYDADKMAELDREDYFYNLVDEIFQAETGDERAQIIENEIGGLVVDEVLARIQEELEATSDDTYGQIVVTEQQIVDLLADMEAVGDDEAARKQVATDFVVDMMCEAMVGQNIAGIYIATKADAENAIALLEKNSNAAGGDPAALREAAAVAVMAEIGDDNVLGINKDNVVELLEAMDQKVTSEARAEVVDEWLNEKAAIKIADKVNDYVPSYTKDNALTLLAEMDASSTDDDSVIAKAHLKSYFTPVLAEKIEEKYTEGGFSLQNYASFTEFAVAINNAADEVAVKALVREEIRAAAAEHIHATLVDEYALFFGGVTEADVLALLVEMDAKDTQAEKEAVVQNWLAASVFGAPYDPANIIMNFAATSFMNGYVSYNNAATTAEDLFAGYNASLNEASSAFANYATLKGNAADTILDMYENQYAGAGETAQKYYTEYLGLRDTAVTKVMNGYADYLVAYDKGMKSVDQMNDKFDTVFDLLCEIAEVDTISLNDLMAVAVKASSNPAGYVAEMIDNLVQGDGMARADKTVAYLALRYYIANALMIMPDANGHAVIASQVIKAINGEGTDSLAGGLANRLIDKSIDMYHLAKKYLQLPTDANGQVETLINPELYVAFGDDVTKGTALDASVETYPEILAGYLAMADDDFDDDILRDYTLSGMRAEELWALVNPGYNGDDYTSGRFGNIADLRDAYAADIANADVITINVGINNLTTYPLTQTLLALNGEETYEMDWGRYIGDARYEKINRGKDKAFDLALKLIGKTESAATSRIPELQAVYDNCENAMNAAYTLVESMLYAMVGYAANLDNAVEDIAEKNPNAVIVLTGFYDPMEDTYFTTGKTFEIAGRTITVPNRTINIEAITHRVINQANRFLTNFVGAGTSAADEGSRIVTAEIFDAELNITANDSVSKNLSVLDKVATVNVKGHDITIKAPEYLLGIVDKNISSTTGHVLHPSANGHKYIANQIIDALDFDIYADVVVNDVTVPVGTSLEDALAACSYKLDDESTLYADLDVKLAIPGYDGTAGTYTVYAKVANAGYEGKNPVVVGAEEYPTLYTYTDENGYHEIDVEFGTLTVVSGKISKSRWTMSLDSVIYLNYYMNLENFATEVDFATQGGVVVWIGDEAPTSGSQLVVEDTVNCKVIPGMFYDDAYGWGVRSDEIFAKDIGNLVYIRPYVEVSEGVYVYQENGTSYSPARFCYDRLNTSAGREDERHICAALLEYATAAQKYFEASSDYKPNYYVNVIPTDYKVTVDKVTGERVIFWQEAIDRLADYKASGLMEYDAAYLNGYDTSISEDTLRAMSNTLDGQRAGVTRGKTPGLDLQGAIRTDVYYKLDSSVISIEDIDWEKSAILFWNTDDFKAAVAEGGLSVENCTEASPIAVEGELYTGKSHHIMAKNLGDTLYYSCRIVMNDGTVYRNGLTRYSPEFFVSDHLNDASNEYGVDDVCKAIVVYSEMAYTRFIKNAD